MPYIYREVELIDSSPISPNHEPILQHLQTVLEMFPTPVKLAFLSNLHPLEAISNLSVSC